MQALILTFMFPLILLNVFGFLGSGIWLAVLGEWGIVGTGIALLTGGSLVLGFLILPGLALTLPGHVLYKRGGLYGVLGFPLFLMGFLWTYVVMCGWALGSANYLLNMADHSSLWSVLILAYGVATGPWAFLAKKDMLSGNDNAAVPTFFLSVGCLLGLISIPFGASKLTVLILFAVPIGVSILIQLLKMGLMMAAEKRS